MRFYFHEEAEAELDHAVGYYEGCRPGLGIEFAQEVYAAIARAVQFESMGSPVEEHAAVPGESVPVRRHLPHQIPLY